MHSLTSQGDLYVSQRVTCGRLCALACNNQKQARKQTNPPSHWSLRSDYHPPASEVSVINDLSVSNHGPKDIECLCHTGPWVRPLEI